MDFVKIITDLLKKNTKEEIKDYITNLKLTVPKEELINILQNKSLDINLKIKNYIIQNGDQIILIFDFIRKIKQEFCKSCQEKIPSEGDFSSFRVRKPCNGIRIQFCS